MRYPWTRWLVGTGLVVGLAGAAIGLGTPARADGWTTPPVGGNGAPILGPTVVPTGAGSPSDVSAAVDTYVSSVPSGGALVGATGGAGYDGAFYIRGGGFSLDVTMLFQARYEAYRWDDLAASPAPGGDLSGFSIPRAVLLLSGTAPCDMRYLALLEFGHHGMPSGTAVPAMPLFADPPGGEMPNPLREGWIEWGPSPAFNVRTGLLKLPESRQMMATAGTQQFVDVSLGSSYMGHAGIGYQDRNRDYGLLVRGDVGPRRQLQYLFAVSNGEGSRSRAIWNGRTDDGFAYSGRLDWDIVGTKRYDEGASRQMKNQWVASVGAWGQYRAARGDRPHVSFGDRLVYGADAYLGYGGLSFTGAFTLSEQADHGGGLDYEGGAWLVQAGYLFPDTPWEIAARWSGYWHDTAFAGEYGAQELAGAVNYYLNGHYNKLTLDLAYIDAADDGNILFDVMAGYQANAPAALGSSQWMLRFQWQLIL